MNAFDFMLAMIVSFAMLAILLPALGSVAEAAKVFSEKIKADSEAERCAMLLDSFYTNNGKKLFLKDAKCTAGASNADLGNGKQKVPKGLFPAKMFLEYKDRHEIKVEVVMHYEK